MLRTLIDTGMRAGELAGFELTTSTPSSPSPS